MSEYTLHVPSVRGATKDAPKTPYEADDFSVDDMSDIDDYFLLSTSGIPPESFTDLYLPVCHVDGRLSLPLLRRALDQIETLEDLDAQTKTETIDMIHDLGECFPNDALDAERADD
ncbi:hypothetical protein SAMN04487947_2515 [Halogeometricum rufum]|jgi:hypothetical protein|uniref:Uncharacterized protein n=1 Tax=Halogeometricum rufum TaxID=553469 RepID=A0A1I6HV09_9EURY|nr:MULTISPECIES: hypothetical protein [Halogeometricum]MUV58930.1 hypothetical protein [Halogeometricum sp. CBA1124]SFR58050.1 hypothetical protein SAMN04487947_2515 [Halogeometricum rufum]